MLPNPDSQVILVLMAIKLSELANLRSTPGLMVASYEGE